MPKPKVFSAKNMLNFQKKSLVRVMKVQRRYPEKVDGVRRVGRIDLRHRMRLVFSFSKKAIGTELSKILFSDKSTDSQLAEIKSFAMIRAKGDKKKAIAFLADCSQDLLEFSNLDKQMVQKAGRLRRIPGSEHEDYAKETIHMVRGYMTPIIGMIDLAKQELIFGF